MQWAWFLKLGGHSMSQVEQNAQRSVNRGEQGAAPKGLSYSEKQRHDAAVQQQKAVNAKNSKR
tara:strand:+ start:3486 stop:3674 length:189 start_codon:yes stop_codon:yes gene_type:complete